MKLSANLPVVAALVGLTACAPTTGVISDFNGLTVKIRQDTFSSAPKVTPQVQAEADTACGSIGKKAGYVSTVQPPRHEYAEHLFFCR